MKLPTLSPGFWRVSVALAMLLTAAVPGSGTLSTEVRYVAAATIQDPPLSDADEQWVQQEAATICDEITSGDVQGESCDFGPEPLTLPLAACLRFALSNTSLATDTARDACGSYVRNPGGSGPRLEFPGDGILAGVDQRIAGQIAIFQEAGLGADALGAFGADLRTCLIRQLLNPDPLSSNEPPRRGCRSAYESPDLRWVAALTQTYSSQLLQLGIGGTDMFDFENRFGGCVRGELSDASSGRGYFEAEAWRAIPDRCRDELARNLPVGGPPTVESLSCTPPIVDGGAVVSCTATLGGTTVITTRRWLAPGGDPPDSRQESFSTSFSEPGMRAITLRACNGADPDDDPAANRAACVEQSRSIEVRGVEVRSTAAPTIVFLDCSPQPAAVNELVSCSAAIDGTVTSSRWVALEGTPSGGDDPTFATRFSAAGSRFIVLAACNGSLCATAEQAVTVTGPTATATPTTQTITLNGAFSITQQDGSGPCSFSHAPQTNGSMMMTVNVDAGTFTASMRGRSNGTRDAVRCDNVTKRLQWTVDYTATVSGSFDRVTGSILAGVGQLQGNETGTYSNCRRDTQNVTCPAPVTYSGPYSYAFTLSGTIGAGSGVANGTLTASGIALTTTGTWNASR